MNWFDLAIVLSIAVSIISGFAHGFARTALGFATFVTAIAAGLWFYGPLGFWLRTYIDSRRAAHATAFVVVFITVMIAGSVIQKTAVQFVKDSDLTWADRILGGGFGLVQGAVWAAVMVFAFVAFAPRPLPTAVIESRYAPRLTAALSVFAAETPLEVREGYERARKDLEESLPDPMRKELDRLTSRKY